MGTVIVDSGGRGGDVTWTEGRTTLRFCWEGTGYGFEIGVPTAAEWTEATGLPATRRDEVIRELGEAFVKARHPRGRWELVEGRWANIQIRG
jgi:hypothetical protein